MNATIEINLDAKCKRCGKKGATPGGLCLTCITKGIEAGEYDRIIKPGKGTEGVFGVMEDVSNEQPAATGSWDWDRPPGFAEKRPKRNGRRRR